MFLSIYHIKPDRCVSGLMLEIAVFTRICRCEKQTGHKILKHITAKD